MPGARRRRLDLGEPEIRRAAMALPRGGGHAAIGPGQRELSLQRLFGHEHDAQRGAFPRRPGEGRSAISPAASQAGAEPCARAFPAARARRNAPVISDNAVVAVPMNWRAESTGNPLPLSTTQSAGNHGKSRSASGFRLRCCPSPSLRSSTLIAMMQAANLQEGDNVSACEGQLYRRKSR